MRPLPDQLFMTLPDMNSASSHSSVSGRRKVWSTAGLVAVGGLALSVVAWAAADQGKPQVTVKVDEQPLARSGVGESASYSPVIKEVAPSVVSVKVTARGKEISPEELPPFFSDPRFRHFFGLPYGLEEGQGNQGRGRGRQLPKRPDQQGEGSGVVVSADGYILTNNHVVNGADEIKVSFNDGRELAAKVVGTDPKTDLAVIKVDAKNLSAVTFADSDKIEVGDKVLAIGNPFGLSQTVTSGMVSALGRSMRMGLQYEDFIQTDAAINPGNSGGALIDVKGRLVGINTAIYSRSGGFQGIGFAIPANLARSVMEQLVSKGKVVRGYLGIRMEPEITDDLADKLSLKNKDGAIVGDVTPGSPAAKGGLEPYDVITKFNDKPVKNGRALSFSVASVAPGTTVPVEVVRDGKVKKLEIKVGEQPNMETASSYSKSEGTLNGVGVADIDPAARREFGIPARVQGALITEVDPESASAVAGLQPGDVIQEINRQPVRSAEDAVKLTESAESKKTLLRVWNRNGSRFVVVDETETEAESP